MHAREHMVPSQEAMPLGSVGHGLHEAPQVAVLKLLTQAPLHRW